MKEWMIIYRPRYIAWFVKCSESLQDEILAHLEVLRKMGPTLGRPRVDHTKRLKAPEHEGAAHSV